MAAPQNNADYAARIQSFLSQQLPENISKAKAEYERIFNQPWENAPTRGTALKEYGGAYFGVPGLSPSAVQKPAGGWRAYQRRVSSTPGAGLAVIGIDPRDPNAEAKAKAWIEYNQPRGSGFWQEGAWGDKFGREDSRVPGFAAMKRQYPNATDSQILDAVMRQQYGQSALPPRSFDIADILVPAGELALGFLGGPTWGPLLAGGLGGGYGVANNGLVGGLLGAAAGAGGGAFGADIASQGLKGAIGSQISGFKDFISNPFSAASNAVPTTPAGVFKTATNVAGNVPSSWVTSGNANRGIGAVLPTTAFGAQAAGAFKPAPVSIAPQITPTAVTQAPLTPQTGPKPMNPSIPAGPPKPLAEGGFLQGSNDPMNPMGTSSLSAYGLASLGRGGDTTLMHVSPGEVDALQKLAEQHGGSLTVNPQTGLPEAGFLSSILPAIAGIGLTVASGGALSPLAAGLLTGGATALITGDLKQGLLGGLGAFGGAGLAGGLGAAGIGAGAAGSGAGAGAGTWAAGNAVPNALDTAANNLISGGAEAAKTAAASQPGFFSGLGNMSLGNAASGLSNIGKGAAAVARDGFSEAGPGVFGLTGGKGLLASGAAALAPAMFERPTPITPRDPWGGRGATSSYEGPWQFKRDVQFPDADRALTDSSEFNYFSPGYYESATGRRMAKGGALTGLMALAKGGTPHKGGYLDGPGDGMSDSIPATIEGRQPARLADGEFVVPADVVSHIGNGSSKAGAKRLYAMMDKIRHARTGTVKQGKQINPDKYLPA